MIEIVPVKDRYNMRLIAQLAGIWLEAFPAYGDNAIRELQECLQPNKLAFAAMEDEKALGFAGVIPQYGSTGWELHPLMVAEAYRGRGIGTKLLQAAEDAVRERGGVTMYLGSDDTEGATSLANCDLYADTWDKIKNIQTLVAERHPYEFYLNQGYSIVGVIPDANGIGKPDIWLAKRL